MAPFAKILPCVILGILAGNALPHLEWWVSAISFVVCAVAGWIWRSKEISGAYTAFAILFFAMSLTAITATRDVMPKGERLVMTMRIDDTPQTSGRWTRATATVDKYRSCDSDDWLGSGEKVVVRFDTLHNISVGDRVIATGRAGNIGSEEYASYVRLMRRRGYSASVWVGVNDEAITLPDKSRTIRYYASLMRLRAEDRLARLTIPEDALSVTTAMTVGSKGSLTPEIRESYSISGASHLLAVSGLHVGIVAILINLLLSFLPFFRHGHIIKNVIAIIAIWLYAMMTGLSPSATRAAMMFSGTQFALASSRKSASQNIFLGTAAIMLLINPNLLYDISFQLSFAAVFGIFILYTPLYSLVRSRFKFANILWSILIVGVAASLATAPLAAYYFGRIPLIGVFINPIVVVTAHVIVLFSILWIIAPIGVLNSMFSAVIGFSANLQNSVVEFCATKSWASAPVSLDSWQVIIIYISATAVWYLTRYRLSSRRKK